jgi:hypothetical protein
MKRLPWRSVMLAGGLVLGACSGLSDETGPFPDGLTLGPTQDAHGDGQLGPVGQTLPDKLQVQALERGRPRSGVRITWTAISGSVSPTSGITDDNGMAQTTWTLGPEPGGQMVSATSPDAPGAEMVFNAMAMQP